MISPDDGATPTLSELPYFIITFSMLEGDFAKSVRRFPVCECVGHNLGHTHTHHHLYFQEWTHVQAWTFLQFTFTYRSKVNLMEYVP